jgi:predicted dehydrogenase
VLAVPPEAQRALAARACAKPDVKTLFLEKPLATRPGDAAVLIETLRRAGVRFRIGYTFLYADWFPRVRDSMAAADADCVTFEWRFMAHHFAHRLQNWKGRHSQGGGVMRFFGIHVLAVLAAGGYRAANDSILAGIDVDYPQRWDATFTGPALAPARVCIDSCAGSARFNIARVRGDDSETLVDQADPFGPADAPTIGDRRVPILKRLLSSVDTADDTYDRLYDETNELWKKVEAVTEFMYRPS